MDRENGVLTRGSLEKRRCLNVILKYKQKKISYTDNPRRRTLIDRTMIVITVAVHPVMKRRLVMYVVDENENGVESIERFSIDSRTDRQTQAVILSSRVRKSPCTYYRCANFQRKHVRRIDTVNIFFHPGRSHVHQNRCVASGNV